jgi:hypothetical protein
MQTNTKNLSLTDLRKRYRKVCPMNIQYLNYVPLNILLNLQTESQQLRIRHARGKASLMINKHAHTL